MSESEELSMEPSGLDVEADGFKADAAITDTEFHFTALTPVSDDDEPTVQGSETTKQAESDVSDTNNHVHEHNIVINIINSTPEQPEISCAAVSSSLIESSEATVYQVQLLRRMVLEVGSALTKRFDTEAEFVLPATLNESTTSELILELKSMVSQLSKESSAAQQPSTEIVPPESEWVEVNDWQPTPNYGLDSPIITHLLSNWTNDNAKIDFLRSWVRSLYMPSYEALNYPPGLHITNLTCVLRDGFMVLLIPLIRSLSKPAITVHVKKHSRSPVPVPLPAAVTPVQVSATAANAVDPFAQDDFLYDIRVKRLDVTLSTEGTAEGGSSSSAGKSAYGHGANAEGYVSDQVAAHNFHQQRAGLKPRPDYSPLAEINSFLPVIEAKTRRSTDGPASPVAYNSRKSFSDEPHVIAAAPALPTPKVPEAAQPAATPQAPTTTSAVDSAAATAATRAPPVPAPSILQSIFSWWEPSPAAATATATGTAAADETASPSDQAASSADDTAAGVEDNAGKSAAAAVVNDSATTPSASLGTTNDTSGPAPTAAPLASAPINVNPVNKIAERLQQMRIQKQPQQLQNKAPAAEP